MCVVDVDMIGPYLSRRGAIAGVMVAFAGGVLAFIVDIDDLCRATELRQRLIQLLVQRPQIWFFVENWKENGDVRS